MEGKRTKVLEKRERGNPQEKGEIGRTTRRGGDEKVFPR